MGGLRNGAGLGVLATELLAAELLATNLLGRHLLSHLPASHLLVGLLLAISLLSALLLVGELSLSMTGELALLGQLTTLLGDLLLSTLLDSLLGDDLALVPSLLWQSRVLAAAESIVLALWILSLLLDSLLLSLHWLLFLLEARPLALVASKLTLSTPLLGLGGVLAADASALWTADALAVLLSGLDLGSLVV